MSSFTSPLVVSPMSDGRRWRLVKSFSYHVGSRNSRHYIRVPKGFVTDFASTDVLQWFAISLSFIYAGTLWFIPSWACLIFIIIILTALLITPYGKQSKAAVLHDWLYKSHNYPEMTHTRKEADLIFREAMVVAGTPAWKAQLMYWGVRLFGWIAWY